MNLHISYAANLLKSKSKLHFLGICGVGMSSLALHFNHRGYFVSGSDKVLNSSRAEKLRRVGISLFSEEDELPFVDLIVVSSAISKNHSALKFAYRNNIPVLHRSQALGFLLNDKKSFGVTGTHGKTTTSALISYLLEQGKFSPTCFVGGEMKNFETNFLAGNNDVFVAEVDESDKSLLNITPRFAVITNVEADHLDNYKDVNDIYETMGVYLSQLSPKAVCILPVDDKRLLASAEENCCDYYTFGFDPDADIYAANIDFDKQWLSYDLYIKSEFQTRVYQCLFGEHNVLNALAAIASLYAANMPIHMFLPFLKTFKGTGRRIELLTENDACLIYDDYAHHPTEIMATLSVLRKIKEREGCCLTVIFQPHRYSRTEKFAYDYMAALSLADNVIVTDIYSAGESEIKGVSSQKICEYAVSENKTNFIYTPRKNIIFHLENYIHRKGIIAFLGAGDITEIAHEYAKCINEFCAQK